MSQTDGKVQSPGLAWRLWLLSLVLYCNLCVGYFLAWQFFNWLWFISDVPEGPAGPFLSLAGLGLILLLQPFGFLHPGPPDLVTLSMNSLVWASVIFAVIARWWRRQAA